MPNRAIIRALIPLSMLVTGGCGSPAARPQVGTAEYLGVRGAQAELLLLGVFHFDDAGLDAYKPRFRLDILSPERQQELDRLVNQLARFRPTKVAVEVRRSEQPRLDTLFQRYLRGDSLGPNEIYQIGFRLAKQVGLTRVYAVDAEARSYLSGDQAREEIAALGFNLDSLLRRIQQDPWSLRYQELYSRDDSAKTLRTIGAHLLYVNDPIRVRVGHGAYLEGSFKLGPDAAYLGVDDATSWYNRNLRIFSNLQAISSPSDRILLVIGAGHLPILRFLAEASPEHRLRNMAEFVTQ